VAHFLNEELSTVHNDPNRAESQARALRRRADRAATKFDEIVRRIGVVSFETHLIDDEFMPDVILLARCSDLLVLGQPDPSATASLIRPVFAEYALVNSGVPALVIPHAITDAAIGERALVAWNASAEAVRAVHYALPLLKLSTVVEIAIINAESHPDRYGEPPGSGIAHYLSRHGLKVEILTPQTNANVGAALLDLAAVRNAGLLVMGCYGHPRFREVVLGGATQTALKSASIPVLMAH
jgi:nucleotide-binding universal stress UspA family protein